MSIWAPDFRSEKLKGKMSPKTFPPPTPTFQKYLTYWEQRYQLLLQIYTPTQNQTLPDLEKTWEKDTILGPQDHF